MPIVVNLDIMLARRKMSLTELSGKWSRYKVAIKNHEPSWSDSRCHGNG